MVGQRNIFDCRGRIGTPAISTIRVGWLKQDLLNLIRFCHRLIDVISRLSILNCLSITSQNCTLKVEIYEGYLKKNVSDIYVLIQ